MYTAGCCEIYRDELLVCTVRRFVTAKPLSNRHAFDIFFLPLLRVLFIRKEVQAITGHYLVLWWSEPSVAVPVRACGNVYLPG